MGLGLTTKMRFYEEIIRELDFDKHSVYQYMLPKTKIVFSMCSIVLLLGSAS